MSFRSIAITLPLILAGCSLDPAYQRPASPVAGHWKGGGDSRAIDWKSFFKDARLRQLIETSLSNNRDIRVAALSVEESRARYRISRSELFPSVNGGAGLTRRHTESANLRQYEVSAGIASYEVDLFGRVRSLNRAALEEYLATDEARRGVQLALVSEIATQYLTELALHEQIALSESTLESVGKNLDLITQRYEAGDVSELDVQSVKVQVQTAKVNLATYRQQLAQTGNAITLLVGGAQPSGSSRAKGLGAGILGEVSAGLPSDLLTRRPDIREAEHGLIAAHANIGAARAAFFPSVTLTGGAGTSSKSLSDLFQSGTGAWSFAPQINVPIFTGGRNRANLDVAEVRRSIEVARYEKAIQTAFREVADALDSRRGLGERISATEALVTAQRQRYDLANARYERGVDSYFEVLNAQQDLYAAQQNLIQLRLARAASQVSLYKSVGGGW